MNKEDERQFFATKSGEPHKVHMEGKRVSFANFPKDVQKKILERLAKKDNVMARSLAGEFPGIKIDGKQVTKDNLHEFEIKPGQIKKEKKVEDKKYSKDDLNKLNFKELKKLAKKLGQTGRSKSGLIKDILKSQ